jgi:hypothetical protein
MNCAREQPWFRCVATLVLAVCLWCLPLDGLVRAQAQESPQVLFDAGVSAYKLVDLAKAEQDLLRAAELLRKTEQTDPDARRLGALVHLYLGRVSTVANRPDAARAHFRAALERDPSLVMVTETDPPKIVKLFDEAKTELLTAQAAGATPGAASAEPASRAEPAVAAVVPAPAAASKRKKKWLWWALGGAAVVTAGIFAIGPGGGGSPGDSLNTITETGILGKDNPYDTVDVVPTKPGVLEAAVTWDDGQKEVTLRCVERGAPYGDCGGVYRRTSNRSSTYTATVLQMPYVIYINAEFDTPERYTFTARFP